MKTIEQTGVSGAVVSKPPVLRRIFAVLLPVVILVAAVLGNIMLAKSKKIIEPKKSQEKSWAITTAPIVVADQTPKLRLFGEAVAGRQVDMRTLVSGEIIETGPNFKPGGIVNKGDLLVVLDAFEYEATLSEKKGSLMEARAKLVELDARARLETEQLSVARYQLDFANTDYERAKKLKKRGTVSQKGLDDREMKVSERQQSVSLRTSNIEIERARIDQQKATIERLKTAVLRAERALKNTRLVAPFDAYIASVGGEKGRFVGVNDPVATLIDRQQIDVRFSLSDGQYGRIVSQSGTVVGRPVQIIWRVGQSENKYVGKIERVSALISAANGGVDVFARLDLSSAATPLRTGAFVEVYLDDQTYSQVVRLPEKSLYSGDMVYVVEDKRLVEKHIELVGYAGQDVLVRGNLKANEKLLTSRLSSPSNGLLVSVK